MDQRNPHWKSKGSKDNCSIFDVLMPVDPLKQANHKARKCNNHDACKIDLNYSEMTVEGVVEGRKRASGNEKTYSCKIKAK